MQKVKIFTIQKTKKSILSKSKKVNQELLQYLSYERSINI